MGYLKKDKKTPELFEYSEGKEKEVAFRIENFCAYQERCEKDVISKLKEWKVPSEMFESILQSLTEENFINQQRFGQAFAGGKFRIKKWGKQKIAMHLFSKNFNQEDVQEAIAKFPKPIIEKLWN
jgi:regulatory protein